MLLTTRLLRAAGLDAVRELGLDALAVGIAYAGAGVGAVLGGALSGVAGRRLRVGGTDITAYAVLAVAYVPVVLASAGPAALPLLVAGQLLFGLGAGLSSPITLAYRQAVTPDRLQARMNATIRSLNWGMIAPASSHSSSPSPGVTSHASPSSRARNRRRTTAGQQPTAFDHDPTTCELRAGSDHHERQNTLQPSIVGLALDRGTTMRPRRSASSHTYLHVQQHDVAAQQPRDIHRTQDRHYASARGRCPGTASGDLEALRCCKLPCPGGAGAEVS